MGKAASLVLFLSLLAVCPVSSGQTEKVPSAPRAAPQISGKLIGTNGPDQVILEYSAKDGRGTFIGKLQATCTLSANSEPKSPRIVPLSEIPSGSRVTLFYVRHAINTKQGRRAENIVLAIRIDKPLAGSKLSAGQTLPCFKASES